MLKKKLKSNEDSEIEKIIKNLIIDIFPNIYLESFNNLKKLNKTFLPINPKFIYTSNEFESNELFKFYSAKNIKNCKYIIGQHGATYGSARHQVSQLYNLKVADKLITWGWENSSKTKKGYLFPKLNKPSGKKPKKITFMTRPLMPMWKSYDLYEELEIEINSDINFVKSINLDLRNIFQIKLHPGDGLFHNFETKKRWQENFKDLNIYDNKTKFDKFKNNSKLFIFNYESTGFLQLININFPTLLILRNFDYQVDESCKKDYESLISAKILHFNNVF